MLVEYVRCMRYAVKRVFDVDYSYSDVLNSKVERVRKKYTPFAFPNRELPSRVHMFCLHDSFLYFRFWNKNHYDYYFVCLPFVSCYIGFHFFEFSREVTL